MIKVEESEDGLGRIEDRRKVSEYFALWNKETLIKSIIKDSDKESNVYFKLGATYKKIRDGRKEIEEDIQNELEELGVEGEDFLVESDGRIVESEGKERDIEDSYIG